MSEQTFNPKDHMLKLKGKDYLPVAARVVWFRDEFPINVGWSIRTRLIDGGFKEDYAVYEAEVVDPEGRIIGTGQNVETKQGFGDFMQKAETGAIGRALGVCGYGTMAALDEGEVVDSPISRSIHNQADPPVHELQCSNCGSDVDWSYAQSTRRKAGKPLCQRCAGQLEVHTAKPVPAGACVDCGAVIEDIPGKMSAAGIVSLSRQKFGKIVCIDCGKKLSTINALAKIPTGKVAG